ncbi:MAG TPA: glycosyltransferase family 1 protein [Candidatus Hydrogenedentes bacterium]|nr:glycosyltransferase family 1 protein [Candidatus Hydrogenedentota bacterium]
MSGAKRLAFVDLMFSWPPHGGADVDLYRTVEGLQALGHEVHLFFTGCETSWERGKADAASLPFPATRLDFTRSSLTPRHAPKRIREALDAWQPDAVVLGHAFFLKPFIADALAHYPAIARYYAYEVACPRDALLFKNGAPCPMNYLRTPDICRRCTLPTLKPRITQWRMVAWTHEYFAARAFMPVYHRRLAASLKRLDAVVVYNALMHSQFEGFTDNIVIVPGGVDTDHFSYAPPEERAKHVILMAGRVEDPMKGIEVLREAGARLAAERSDFEIHATHPNFRLDTSWFKAIGWQSPEDVVDRHHEAAICAVPSVWEEPFGLAAVEAMAAGRPVCASRVGGLQHIVRDGETGFLFERGDAAALADCLRRLLDDAELRRRMGEAGRRVVEQEYDWRRLIERHWPPLVEKLLP